MGEGRRGEFLFWIDCFLNKKISSAIAFRADSAIGKRMNGKLAHLDKPVLEYARKDFPLLQQHFTIGEALRLIRQEGIGEKIVYFYVMDEARSEEHTSELQSH